MLEAISREAYLGARFVLVGAILVLLSGLSYAASQTHCGEGEAVVFSCSFKNSKTVSLCATGNLSKDDGKLQYRYGVVGKRLELVFPISPQHPSKQFSLSKKSGGLWHQTEIGFVSNNYRYAIFSYENVALMENDFSLLVWRDKKMIAHLNCNESTVIDKTEILDGVEMATPSDNINQE